MATLAFGLVGAAIGSTGVFSGIAGMIGMTSMGFGWTLGQWIGGMFGSGGQTQHQEGPRLSDLKVTNSAYGTGIPVVYGTMRIAGNIIDSTDKIEHKTTHSSGGGKGMGGGPKTEYTEYTYSISCLIGLCEGPITGIKRMWFNNKLVYDAGSGSVTSLTASSLNAAGVTVYLGSETQEPDPTFEAIRGVGNCPAYRGVAYISINNMQLADYGNSLPNIEVEVVVAGTTQGPRKVSDAQQSGLINYTDRSGQATSGANFAGNAGAPWIVDSDVGILYAKATTYTAMDALNTPEPNKGATLYGLSNDGNAPALVSSEPVTTANIYYFPKQSVLYWAERGCGIAYVGTIATGSLIQPYAMMYLRQDSNLLIDGKKNFVEYYTINVGYEYFNIDALLMSAGESGRYLAGAIAMTDFSGMYILTSSTYFGTPDRCLKITASDGKFYIESQGTVSDMPSGYYRFHNHLQGFDYHEQASISCDGYSIWEYIQSGVGGHLNCYSITGSNIKYKCSVDAPEFGIYDGLNFPSIWVKGGICTLASWSGIAFDSARICNYTAMPSVADQTVSLSSIVSDLCSRSGMNPTEYDVTQLTQAVDGIVISKPTSARAIMNDLQSAYYWDMVETDGLLRCVNRGGSAIAEFSTDDMAAFDATSGSGDVPDIVKLTRIQEMELPAEVNVTYMSKNASYQEGSQYDRRLNTKAVNVVSTQLPMSLTDTHAASIASVGLYSAWQERVTFQFTTTRKYAHIDPTDVVYLTKDGIRFKARITKRTDTSDGTIGWEAVREDSDVYTQVREAGTTNAGNQTVDYPAPMNVNAFNIPPLRDSDSSSSSYYVAVNSSMENGGNGLIYNSTDSGATWNSKTKVSGQCGVGVTTAALAAPGSFALPDEANALYIRIQPWINLESIAFADFLNKQNAILVGSEIIQFRNASSQGNGVWKLTGLLRGLMGTESYASHAANEKVILLDPSNLRVISTTSGELNAAQMLSAVPWGGSLATTRRQTFTPKNTNILPIPVCNISAVRDSSSGTWYLSWYRRARAAYSWNSGADVPLDETTEQYKVRIYSDATHATVKATYTTSSPSLTYTLSQQNTDIGGSSASGWNTIYYGISQVGAAGESLITYGSQTLSYLAQITDVYMGASLLHFDGADGSTTFTDEYGNTWTAGGSAAISTAQSVFGGSSLYLDGSSYLASTNVTPKLSFGTSDFSIQARVRLAADSIANSGGTRDACIVSANVPASGSLVNCWILYMIGDASATGTKLLFQYWDGSGAIHNAYSSNYSFAKNQFYLITVDRKSGSFYFSVNGNQIGVASDSIGSANIVVGTSNPTYIGQVGYTGYVDRLIGHIDELLILPAVAPYTSSFSVPTSPYAKYAAGLHFDGADGSTTFTDVTGKVWTANAPAAISTVQYKFGGASGYFNGGSARIITPDHEDFNFGTGAFAYEFFVYPTDSGRFQRLVNRDVNAGGTWYWCNVGMNADLSLFFEMGTPVAYNMTTSGRLTLNAFNHVVCMRIWSGLYVFINGHLDSVVGYIPAGVAAGAFNAPLVIGADQFGGSPFAGFIDDFRVIKGLPPYYSLLDFTPPSAPFK